MRERWRESVSHGKINALTIPTRCAVREQPLYKMTLNWVQDLPCDALERTRGGNRALADRIEQQLREIGTRIFRENPHRAASEVLRDNGGGVAAPAVEPIKVVFILRAPCRTQSAYPLIPSRRAISTPRYAGKNEFATPGQPIF